MDFLVELVRAAFLHVHFRPHTWGPRLRPWFEKGMTMLITVVSSLAQTRLGREGLRRAFGRMRKVVEELDEERFNERVGLHAIDGPEGLQALVIRAHEVSPALCWASFFPILGGHQRANAEAMGVMLKAATTSTEELYVRLVRESTLVDLCENLSIPSLQVLLNLTRVACGKGLPNKNETTIGRLTAQLQQLQCSPELYDVRMVVMRNSFCHGKPGQHECDPDAYTITFHDKKRSVTLETQELQELILEQLELHDDLMRAHTKIFRSSILKIQGKANLLALLGELEHLCLSESADPNFDLLESYFEPFFDDANEADQEEMHRYLQQTYAQPPRCPGQEAVGASA